MNGNWEILIGTVSGFIIAFFAEPFKSMLQRNFERDRLRNMLYQEIIDNHIILKNRMPNLSSPALTTITKFGLQTEGYKHAKNNNIALFYELKEASCFNQLYSICEQLQNIDKKNTKRTHRTTDGDLP
jgi:hypothetical protein